MIGAGTLPPKIPHDAVRHRDVFEIAAAFGAELETVGAAGQETIGHGDILAGAPLAQ